MTKLYDDSTSTVVGSYSVYDLLGGGPGPDYQSFSTSSSAATLSSLVFDLSDGDPTDGDHVDVTFSRTPAAAPRPPVPTPHCRASGQSPIPC
jgi:hypothetical protein